MGKSGELRLADVRQACRLIGECRDLGRYADKWRQRAHEGIARLLGARATNGGEVVWVRPSGIVTFVAPVVTGFCAAELAVFAPFMRTRDPRKDPIFAGLGRLRGDVATRTRPELVADASWYRSISFNDYRRVVGVDHCIYTRYTLPAKNSYNIVGLHRALGDRGFSSREANLLHFFHEELGRLIGSVLSSGAEAVGLSPRLRQTLDRLLEGDSEKQVALRLGVSVPTVHQYVTDLYRRFGVSSRAELMASFIRKPSTFDAARD